MITGRGRRARSRSCGIEKIRVRSPLTCEAPLGVCAPLLRRGPVHRPAGRGGHGRRHHRRPVDRRAGHAAHHAYVPHRRRRPRRGVEENEIKRQAAPARSSSRDLQRRDQRRGRARSPSTRNGEIPIVDAKGRELEKLRGARRRRSCSSRTGRQVKPRPDARASGTRTRSRSWPRTAAWSASRTSSRARPCREESDAGRARPPRRSSSTRASCTRRSSSRTTNGKILDFHYLPEKARIEVEEGAEDRGRHAARQDAARGRRHAGHHRRSAARHRDLRGPQAQGARRSWPRSPAASSCGPRSAAAR